MYKKFIQTSKMCISFVFAVSCDISWRMKSKVEVFCVMHATGISRIVSRNTAKLYIEIKFSHVVELCCRNGIKSSWIYVSDVPKVAVFRDASRHTSSVHHAKYFYLWLHPSRDIAADRKDKRNTHFTCLYKFLVLYLGLFIHLFYNSLIPLRFILPFYIVYTF